MFLKELQMKIKIKSENILDDEVRFKRIPIVNQTIN